MSTKAAEERTWHDARGDERQQALYRKSFTDLNLIKRLLPQIIGASWTDDGVWVHVTVKFVGGETWTAETQALNALYAPVVVQGGGKNDAKL